MTRDAGWHPVALGADLDPGTATGTRLFGREIVVWRDAGGEAHVWEDRCPHRGMRLSFGFVRDDRLACLYHGWQFDGAGKCRFIPAHPKLDVPDTIKVAGYPSVERLGMVWVRLGDGPEVEEPPGDNPDVIGVRSITIMAPEAKVLAVLEAEPCPFDADSPLVMVRTGAVVGFPQGGFFAALQPLSADETCLHVVIGPVGSGDPVPFHGEPASFRAGFSTWAEGVRRRAETEALLTNAPAS